MKRNAARFTIMFSLLFVGCDEERVADKIGKSCTSDAQCPSELFCSTSSPTDVCAGHCTSDQDCLDDFGSGFGCVNGHTRCARRCFSESDCPDADCVSFTDGHSYCSNSL